VTDDAVPLREHLERLIADQARRFDDLRAADKTALDAALTSADKAVRAALDAAEKAVVKAEISTNDRLELLNELRKGIATSAELNALNDKVADLKARVDKSEAQGTGRAGGLKDYIGWIAAVVAIAGTIISLLVRR
jgi:hypothetical protein